MKKTILYSLIIFLAACNSEDKKPTTEPPPPSPLSKTKNSDAFNTSFEKVLGSYIHLKDNFITESITLIDFHANELINATNDLKFSELKGDAGIAENAKSIAQGFTDELKRLKTAKDITEKRKSFNAIGDQLYNLIRIVQYDKKVIYHQHYAEAFKDGDPNAYWLSLSRDIKNPYEPTKLLTGDLADSLDYSK